MKILLPFLVAFLVSACNTLPNEQQFTIPIQQFNGLVQADVEGDADNTAEYQLNPNDQIDVLYKFNLLSDGIYHIAPHDRIKVDFLAVEELNDVHKVRPDGYISLPYVGDIYVAGLSVDQFKFKLTKIYKPILTKPTFFVSLVDFQVHLKSIRESLVHPSTGLTRSITVREDYMMTIPLLDDISVKDKTLKQVQQEINEQFKSTHLDISVDLAIKEIAGKNVYVFGEVHKPGRHLFRGKVNLIQAIAIAGGASKDSNLETVLLLSNEGTEVVAKVYNVEDILLGRSDAYTTELKENDMVYIPNTKLSKASQIASHISNIIMFRGIGVNASYRIDENDGF